MHASVPSAFAHEVSAPLEPESEQEHALKTTSTEIPETKVSSDRKIFAKGGKLDGDEDVRCSSFATSRQAADWRFERIEDRQDSFGRQRFSPPLRYSLVRSLGALVDSEIRICFLDFLGRRFI